MFRRLKRELNLRDGPDPVPIDIPRDPQKFYEDFGFLLHPRQKDANGFPALVKQLTPYQYEFWKYQGDALAIKSQKIGLSTSCLLEDFQFTLLPEGAGKDVLIIAQNEKLATDHIRTLKLMIYNSEKYSQLLLDDPATFREEKSKASEIFVKNPFKRKAPSRIIGLGRSESSVWSWKNVGKVHMSDVAMLEIKDQRTFFGAVYSRLANTEGIVKIETPPNGQQGEVFNIYNKSKIKWEIDPIISDTFADDPRDHGSKFKIFEYPVQLAVDSGIISQQFIDKERRHIGDALFSQLYECSFLPPGAAWYSQSMIFSDDYGVCA